MFSKIKTGGAQSFRRTFGLAILFTLQFLNTACTSNAVAIDDVMIPYVSLKQTIKKVMPQGLSGESENGREMISGYFAPTNFYENTTTKPERMYAKVLVLGSSRPYRMEFHVFRERRQKSGHYSLVGEDIFLSKQLAQYFKEALADSREDKGLIDEFRPF